MSLNLRPSISLADTASVDAFSRLRVSNNNIIFTNEFLYDKRPKFWDEQLTGTGSATFNVNRASVLLEVAANSDEASRTTREYFRYLSGQGQQIFLTFVGMQPQTDVTKRLGYFDPSNGLFLEASAGTLKFVRRTNATGTPVDTPIEQADWNIDKFDGTGPSGIVLDPSKSHILLIDFQWLGVGRVRFGFDIDGKIFYAHEILNANNLDVVYMSSPTLPIRYEISSQGGVGSLEQICAAVNREGGNEDRGVLTSVTTGLGVGTATTTLRSLITTRLRTTHLRGNLVPLGASLLPEGSGVYQWQLILNPVLSAAPTTWV
jgi:hypothetical protein